MSPLPNPASYTKSGLEHGEQVALFCWASQHTKEHPELADMFAIPNGGKRDKITAANLKAEGVKAGVPDIFLPAKRGPWCGLFIEMKAHGKKAEKEQLEYIARLQKAGYGAIVCVGWEAARDTILAYLNWKGV